MPIVIEQVRAARELLDWTQAQLAEAAAINLSTVKSFECELRLPTQENFLAVWRAFKKAGILFENDGDFLGVTVKRRRTIYDGGLIGARQSRAARKLLGWSQSDLSSASSLSFGAVRNFEGEQRVTSEARLLAILRAFEGAGIVFDNDERVVGVKMKVERSDFAEVSRRRDAPWPARRPVSEISM
jgi:transcriptional regulator with XRE-family HTH domain